MGGFSIHLYTYKTPIAYIVSLRLTCVYDIHVFDLVHASLNKIFLTLKRPFT